MAKARDHQYRIPSGDNKCTYGITQMAGAEPNVLMGWHKWQVLSQMCLWDGTNGRCSAKCAYVIAHMAGAQPNVLM